MCGDDVFLRGEDILVLGLYVYWQLSDVSKGDRDV